MRFMTLVKSSEALGPPPKPLMDAMAGAGAGAVKGAVFTANAKKA